MRSVKVRLQKQLFMHFLLMMTRIMVGLWFFLLSLSKSYMNMLGNDKGGRLTALIVGILGVVNPPHANILYRLKLRMAVIEY